jgi:hypothetical protein
MSPVRRKCPLGPLHPLPVARLPPQWNQVARSLLQQRRRCPRSCCCSGTTWPRTWRRRPVNRHDGRQRGRCPSHCPPPWCLPSSTPFAPSRSGDETERWSCLLPDPRCGGRWSHRGLCGRHRARGRHLAAALEMQPPPVGRPQKPALCSPPDRPPRPPVADPRQAVLAVSVGLRHQPAARQSCCPHGAPWRLPVKADGLRLEGAEGVEGVEGVEGQQAGGSRSHLVAQEVAQPSPHRSRGGNETWRPPPRRCWTRC